MEPNSVITVLAQQQQQQQQRGAEWRDGLVFFLCIYKALAESLKKSAFALSSSHLWLALCMDKPGKEATFSCALLLLACSIPPLPLRDSHCMARMEGILEGNRSQGRQRITQGWVAGRSQGRDWDLGLLPPTLAQCSGAPVVCGPPRRHPYGCASQIQVGGAQQHLRCARARPEGTLSEASHTR